MRAGAILLALIVGCSRSPAGGEPAAASSGASRAASAAPPARASAAPDASAVPADHDPSLVPPAADTSVRSSGDLVWVVAWRPNGKSFFASSGKVAASFPAGPGPVVPLVGGGDRPVVGATFTRDGKRLATVDDAGAIRSWDPSTGRLVAELPGAVAGEVHALAFSPDGRLLAAAGSAATVWNVDKKTRLCTTEPAWIFDLAFTPDAGSLVTTGAGAMARWDAATCASKVQGGAPTGGTFGSWVAPDGTHLAAAAPDGHGLAVYAGRDLRAIDTLAHSFGCRDHIGPVRFSRDGQILLASGYRRWFKSFRVASWKTIGAYDVPDADGVDLFVMFDDGERLLVSREGRGELVSVPSKSVAFAVDLAGVVAVDVSWDGRFFAGVGSAGARVWDAATGKVVVTHAM